MANPNREKHSMKNNEYDKAFLEDTHHQFRGHRHRRSRPNLPSVVSMPQEDSTTAPPWKPSTSYPTTVSQHSGPIEAVVSPYQQYSPESQSTRSACNPYYAMQHAAAGSSSNQPNYYPWPPATQSPQSYEYPRYPPPAKSSWPQQHRQMPEKNLEKQEHPLKKVNVDMKNSTSAQYHLTVDTSSEGEEFTALIKGIHDVGYGAMDMGTRCSSDMSPGESSSVGARRSSDWSPTGELSSVKIVKARSRSAVAHGEGLEPPSQRPPKRPDASAGTSNQDGSPRRSHRRHNSDNSRTSNVPARPRSLTNYEGSPLRSRAVPRTFSSSSLNIPAASSKHHRRRSSNSVFSSVGSIMTDASMMTLVTDIEKSSLFAGYDEVTGQALFNLPISSVQISMEDHQEGMTPGELYQFRENDQTFENYHRLGDPQFGFGEDLVYGRTNHFECSCMCMQTNAFTSRQSHALPPTSYIINVPTDLYRRVVDEISSSSSLPCGLFFCGHHEDVAKPSLLIAVLVLACLFCSMGFAAYIYRG